MRRRAERRLILQPLPFLEHPCGADKSAHHGAGAVSGVRAGVDVTDESGRRFGMIKGSCALLYDWRTWGMQQLAGVPCYATGLWHAQASRVVRPERRAPTPPSSTEVALK